MCVCVCVWRDESAGRWSVSVSLIGGGMTRHRRSNIGRTRAAERGNETEYSASVTPELPRERERERIHFILTRVISGVS